MLKIRSSFKIDSKTTDLNDSWVEVEIDVPKPWSVKADCLSCTNLCVNSFTVVPEFETNNTINLSGSCSGFLDPKFGDHIFVILCAYDLCYLFFRKSKEDIILIYLKIYRR